MMNMAAHTNSISGSAPTNEPPMMRARVIAGIVFLALAVITAVSFYMGWSSMETAAFQDAWDFLPQERGLRPLPTQEVDVTVMVLTGDEYNLKNFLANDVARHGGYWSSGRTNFVAPLWYYEELRSLELEQSDSADFDASTYVDWTEKMVGIPDKVEVDNFAKINVYWDVRSGLLPGKSWFLAVPMMVIAIFAGVAALVSLMVVFSPGLRERQSKLAC